MGSYNGSSRTRGLLKSQLGGVIFRTNEKRINDCLCKKLFGLASSHFVYVKKIIPGLPVFLFNYSDRTILGIFEAASSGQMNIDPCAWTCDGSQLTPYPAQLIENLDELMAFKATQNDTINQLEQKIAFLEQNLVDAKAEIKSLKDMSNTSIDTCVGPQEYDDVCLADEIILADDPILLVGGFDGGSWLSSLDCYTPSQNLTKSLSPMNTERCYAAVSKLDGELFVFGGGTCGQWFDTVESYDPVSDQWTTCPPLNKKNGSLAGATLNDKIYAIGGGNGVDCYSTVEMLDFEVGAWIPSRSMLEKRFTLAAAELNGALYAVGGYEGKYYLRTAERFDPRERSWKKIESMSTIRGCPSMVVLNEKLYVLGGYDGKTMVSTVEIYDPRRGSWVFGEPMNHPRGFSAATIAKDSIYIIGGLKSGDVINDTVECYKEGQGWEMTNTNDAYRRCFFSAIAL